MQGAAAGYYGKLPFSPEFLRYRAAGTEIEGMDEWLQEGIHHATARLGSVWSAEFALAGPWNFLFFPEGGSRLLMGVLVPSRDQAGREFPFVLFLRLELPILRTPYWLAPLQYGSFFEEFRDIMRTGGEGTDVAELRSRLDAIPILRPHDGRQAIALYRQQVRMTTMRQWWTDLLGDFSHPAKYHLDQALGLCLEPLRVQPSKPSAWGLKFPLLPEWHGETYDLPFWLDLIARRLKDRREPSLLLWTRVSSKVTPCMMIAFGKPPCSLVLFLIRPDQPDRDWYDLALESNQDTTDLGSRLSAARRELLDTGDLSMEDFLQHAEQNSER